MRNATVGFYHTSGNATVTASTIRNHSNYGIDESSNGHLSLTGNTFSGNSGGAVFVNYGSGVQSFTHSGNTASGSGTRGFIMSGSMGNSHTWTADDMPYVISSQLTVNSGKTLAIEPNAVIKFQSTSARLSVSGNLDIQGTAGDKVYFTSIKDDTVGGDTNADSSATSPAAGDWRDINFSSTASSTITHAVIRYGGNSACCGLSAANLYNNGGTLTVLNSEIASSSNRNIYQSGGTLTVSASELHNASVGFYHTSGNATVTASTIRNHSNYGIDEGSNGHLSLTGNTFSGNSGGAVFVNYGSGVQSFTHSGNTASGSGTRGFIMSGSMGNSHTWTADDMPYVISGLLTVSSGKTLTITGGSVVKFANTSSYIAVSGTLNSYGYNYEVDKIDAIYLTSLKDDMIGGDTNGDGSATTPSRGDWRGIELASGATSTILWTNILFGGNNIGPDGSVYNNGGTLTIATSTVASSTTSGIFHAGGTTSVSGSVIQYSSIYGVRNTTTSTLPAQNNFWGHHSGPAHTSNPGGGGDSVTDYVDFSNWYNTAHYYRWFDSVGCSGGSCTLKWDWAASTTQLYAGEIAAAISTWDSLGEVTILQDESPSLFVEEVYDTEATWAAAYTWNLFSSDKIRMNTFRLDGLPSRHVQHAAAHEFGHALGLDHSHWSNIMFDTVSGQTFLGVQDITDYRHCWPGGGEDNC